MLRLVIRRMFSNLWMVVSLLVGTILASALVSSIPIYTDGILQRMLTKDLESFQLDTGVFPGQYTIKGSLYYSYSGQKRYEAYRYFDSMIMPAYMEAIPVPVIAASQNVKLSNLFYESSPASDDKSAVKVYGNLGALSGIEEHITITKGRMFTNQASDGVFEVVVSRKAMQELKLLLNREYTLMDPIKENSPVAKVRVVGIYGVKSENDPYWAGDFSAFDKEMLMEYKLFNAKVCAEHGDLVMDTQWNIAYDYHQITLQNLSAITDTLARQEKWFAKYAGRLSFSMPAEKILQKYDERAKQLKIMLWVLTLPVLVMLVFYIYMVAQLIVRNDENGIAVLKSRGGGRSQILYSYLLESALIGALAFAAGPPLGMAICSVLGSSSGFLEFVQRTALPVSLNLKVYGYALGASVFLILTMLLPVLIASGTTIVTHKQSKARAGKVPFWKKSFLDVLLLLASGYGLYRYRQQLKVLEITGVSGLDIRIDPLLFLTSTLFILGAGLLFLRFYPTLIRLIYWIGRKAWSPVLYISLIQMGRSRGQELFLMLFIILAIATGFFNANSARTVNKNMEDKVNYSVGADVALMARWQDNQPPPGMEMVGGSDEKSIPLRYYEPDYKSFSTLSGTETATKVLMAEPGIIRANSGPVSNVKIMGIIPDEFAKVAWFRPDLLPYHWYQYLNLMTKAPKAFLVSSNLKEKYKLALGDSISITWSEQDYLDGRIYAFIDYWPAYNPNPPEKGRDAPGLVVANLNYIQNKMALQPYEVWIKKKADATDQQINNDILGRKLDIQTIRYRNQEIIKTKNDAFLQGMNGMLSLGFIAAMLISMLGFLIYWIISIQNRVLQFGILRAMGMSLAKVIGMLAAEQVLVSGASILIGIVIGGMAGALFIPLLQIVYSSADQVPPFRVVASGSDYGKVYAILGFMLLIGFLAIWRLISKIRIDQAVKLGED